MKKYLLVVCIIASFGMGYAQDKASSFSDKNNDQPRDPRVDQMSFVPNEVLVKFKDEVPLSNAVRLRSAGLSAVDKVLQANGIDSLVRLFPNTKSSLLRSTGVARVVKDPQGHDMIIPNLNKIYKITLPQLRSTSSVPVNLFQVIEDLKALPEVEYAEPNYIYSVDDLKPVGPVITADDMKKMQSGSRSSQAAVVPNDPLYSQQWYIPAVKADLVWEQTTGDTTQVIGILDTGIDWNHPDLKNKIWTNQGEIPSNGRDDDGNGLIDDIRGWDYINNDNNPMDDNSHGTHVAGIAAAEMNNGIGIVGVCPNAKILPIKVFQSTGRGDVATISKGILYAAEKGATVINMSFGSYSKSMAMDDALANAYATCVLVASAGNDNLPIGPGKFSKCYESNYGSPSYPAALTFVLGVQSPEACFSNYDQDGPVYSVYSDLLNYEMKAPGTNILSTIPNGNYRVFQGTSMAAPIISGVVALYRNLKPMESQELLFGNFINSTSEYLDILKAITIVPVPQVSIVSYEVTDTLDGDGDGRPDVGETIELKVYVRNTWGQANNVSVGIDTVEFEDRSAATILSSEALIGSISAYAKRYNVVPLKLKISENVADGRDIQFVLRTWYDDHQGETSQNIVINVENGIELKGVIAHDMTLYPNKQYIITENIVIPEGVTFTIKPGTILQFSENKSIALAGSLVAIGKPDSLISFKKRELGNSWNGITLGSGGNLTLDYCEISYAGLFNNQPTSIFGLNNSIVASIKNSIFTSNFGYFYLPRNLLFDRCNVINNFLSNIGFVFYPQESAVFTNSIFINNINNIWSGNIAVFNCSFSENISGNSIFNNFSYNRELNLAWWYPQFFIDKMKPNYFGSTSDDKINKSIYDFGEDGSLPLSDISQKLLLPSRETHGIVWKINVNDKDAQDEFDLLDPVGVGKQKFEIFFNRAMDINFSPTVSMGVRYPYSQTAIAENGNWSSDSTIYTVYKNVGLTTGDGINTIRVTGAKDMDHFEIPIEDRRFRVVVSAASSSSLNFQATAGLGKVSLEWNNNDLEDGLGYNMYRMEQISDSTVSDPVLINESLITDTLYTDYSVVPNRRYFYYYKVLRTNMSETDASKTTSTVPFTASKGDANGDLSVNVLDITTIVSYLLNNNPQPFITEAADMNSDGNINVLDIVGVVNHVLYGGLRSTHIAEDQQASLYLQNDTLFADASTAIGGLQFDVRGVSSINDIQVLNALQAFESGYSQRDSTTLRLLYYSMSGKSIAAGNRIPLLKLKKDCSLKDVIVSDKAGALVPVSLSDPKIGNRNNQGMTVAELGQNYPNPSKGQTTLPFQIFEKVDEAAISIYNMLGQRVKVIKLDNPTVGKHEILWNSPENKGLFIYKLEIRIGGQQYVSPLKKMIIL